MEYNNYVLTIVINVQDVWLWLSVSHTHPHTHARKHVRTFEILVRVECNVDYTTTKMTLILSVVWMFVSMWRLVLCYEKIWRRVLTVRDHIRCPFKTVLGLEMSTCELGVGLTSGCKTIKEKDFIKFNKPTYNPNAILLR